MLAVRFALPIALVVIGIILVVQLKNPTLVALGAIAIVIGLIGVIINHKDLK